MSLPTRATFVALALAAAFAAHAQTAPESPRVTVVEFYHQSTDHYFITADASEIATLEASGSGWARTGNQFQALQPGGPTGVGVPVCRYRSTSGGVENHFFATDCEHTSSTASAQWMLESADVFDVEAPDARTGACHAGSTPVFRLAGNGKHPGDRFTTDVALRASMLQRGYVSEGYGPDGVAFCSPGEEFVAQQVAAIVASSATEVASAKSAATPDVVKAATAATRYVQLSAQSGGTDFVYASSNLHAPWRRLGGDFTDKNGILNGPTSNISVPITWASATYTIDISKVSGDLLLRWQGPIAAKWASIKIDGVEASAFWVDPSANHPVTTTPYGSSATFVRNTSGKKMTITASNIYQPGTLFIDPVALPEVPALPFTGPSNKPTIVDLNLTDEATIRASMPRGSIAEPFAYNAEFGVDAATGLHYLRAASVTQNQRLIRWNGLVFSPRREVYGRQCLYIESDVGPGFNELGLKLSGIGAYGEPTLAWVLEHSPPAPDNPDLYGLSDYRYSYESGNRYGNIASMNVVLSANRWYCFEQYAKFNTPGQSDGRAVVWVNGTKVFDVPVRWSDDPARGFEVYAVQLYHGGMGLPKAPFHYRIARIAVSDSYIGVPPEFATGGSGSDPTPPSNPTPPAAPVNVALASNGATASASSTHSAKFAASGAIDGDRKGVKWANNGGWNDGTSYVHPDWLQVNFNGSKQVNKIDVFTLQDAYSKPVDPTATMTFSSYGIKAFEVQTWNGSAWVTVPGGSVTGNNKVWRSFTFPTVTTDRIRILVTGAPQYSRITEVEAWSAP